MTLMRSGLLILQQSESWKRLCLEVGFWQPQLYDFTLSSLSHLQQLDDFAMSLVGRP